MCSQTCSNNHLYKMTTRLRQQIVSLSKQILIQSLLYKTTTCLTRPAATYFVLQMKKNLPKTATAKLYLAEKWEAMHKNKSLCIKIMIMFTVLLRYNAVCLMLIKSGYLLNTRLPN